MHQVLTAEVGDACCSVLLQPLYLSAQLKLHCVTPEGKSRKQGRVRGVAVNCPAPRTLLLLICQQCAVNTQSQGQG